MVKRGEIYWYQFPVTVGSAQSGTRPVLVVQNDAGNRTSTTTIVAAITSRPRPRHYPFHVPFSPEDSVLRLGGLVLCEQIHTVEQQELGQLLGALDGPKMREVDQALHHSLALTS